MSRSRTSRSRILMASAVFAAAGLALTSVAAKADGILGFGKTDPAVQAAASNDRLLAKTAFTQVLAKKSTVLGMVPPGNLAPYAPVYPDGLILQEALSSTSATGGTLEYDAAAPLRATLDFYEDAAALQHMPFTVTAEGPDILMFKAARGARQVQAKLTRQFANSTVVDLSYS